MCNSLARAQSPVGKVVDSIKLVLLLINKRKITVLAVQGYRLCLSAQKTGAASRIGSHVGR